MDKVRIVVNNANACHLITFLKMINSGKDIAAIFTINASVVPKQVLE